MEERFIALKDVKDNDERGKLYESLLTDAGVGDYLRCYKGSIHIKGMDGEVYIRSHLLDSCRMMSGSKTVFIDTADAHGDFCRTMSFFFPDNDIATKVLRGLAMAHRAHDAYIDSVLDNDVEAKDMVSKVFFCFVYVFPICPIFWAM